MNIHPLGLGVIDLEKLGYKIRLLRHKRALTQQEIAYRTGISTPHISSIERGERQPSLEYAIRIAEALGVPVGYFADNAEVSTLPDAESYQGIVDMPGYLQSFITRESAQPYLAMAHRVSRLDETDYNMICAMIEIMAQRKRLKNFTDIEI
ncbi:transcriptional regulator [Ferroacidibacillus organovorans]|uniref:Transcriptional regulator n=1 Tax=Ferroacidibacillus organovorans TaxID=1765683 RepID=A0A1V4EVC2_9BACL|nr:transcriptional regulator [Ferroacidibacillus organovorans]